MWGGSSSNKNNNSKSPSSETTPLVTNNSNTNNKGDVAAASPSSYYFTRKIGDASGGGSSVNSSSINNNDADGGQEIEELPTGTTEEQFAPRSVVRNGSIYSKSSSFDTRQKQQKNKKNGGGFLGFFFGGGTSKSKQSNNNKHTVTGDFGTMVKTRKAPIKVEPKVFFANERTFLAWLHVSIMLAGASIAIVAFADANPLSQLYGVLLLPVAIAFISYAMYQYSRRAQMIRRKDPGPYEDTVGPTVLGIMLMISIVAQFALKLYSIST